MAERKKQKPALVPYLEEMVQLELHDEAARERYPILTELLMPKYSEGHLTRQEGSLRIQPRGPVWQIGLECPSESAQCAGDFVTLVGLIEALEERLASHQIVWHQSYKKRRRDLNKLDRPV